MRERDTVGFWTREGLREKVRAFAAFSSWSAAHPQRLEGADALAAVGDLYELLPEAARRCERDPRFAGVQRMMAILERWTPGSGRT